MNIHSLRKECDSHFRDDSCLRKIAFDIASLEWADAKRYGLINANPAPYNLLSNGETGPEWTIPTQILPDDLIAWKKGANGFGGSTYRGLSLMFDPFVDACLMVEAKVRHGSFRQTNVLVLTDYYPLKHVIGEMSVLPGEDWAAIATGGFFKAKELGTTGNNLLKALFEKTSIEDVRGIIKTDPEAVSTQLTKYHLLIWNYFPFMRGGSDCEGMNGLPTSKCDWIAYCDGLLLKFLKCVKAAKVVFAMNRGVKDIRRDCPNKAGRQIEVNYPGTKTLDLDHPGSWRADAKLAEDGDKLRKFLLD
jgi:hypothetical protein